MKTLIPILACSALLILPACTTVPEAERLATRVEGVADRGTGLVLISNPEYREGFAAAQVALEELSRDETITFDDIGAILSRLPVDELKSEKAMIAIEGGLLLIDLVAGGAAIDLSEYESARIITVALAAGIGRALERTAPPQTPPTPTQ